MTSKASFSFDEKHKKVKSIDNIEKRHEIQSKIEQCVL